MSNPLKISLFVGVGILLFGLAYYFYIYDKVEGLQNSTTRKNYKVAFDDFNDTIFIRASMWGFTGDHIEIQLANSPIINRGSDSTTDYIFYEPTIYYKQKNDTLMIYTPSLSNVPIKFNTKIKIIQVEINNPEEINNYKETYKSLGLNKVSVYN